MANEQNVNIKIQDVEISSLPRTLQESYRRRLGTLLDLTEEQKKRLKGWLKKRIDEWVDDTQDLHRMLEEDNDLVEGIVDEVSGVYDGWGSNVHVDVTGIYMDVFLSIEKRSILGAENIWFAESENEEMWDKLADVESYLNKKSRTEWNIAETIPMAIYSKNRDGLCAVKITWEEDYEKVSDIIICGSVDDFLNEFPNPEEAGLDVDQWVELANYISENATDEFPVEIPMTCEQRKYYGNKAQVVELINFVTIPATVTTIYNSSCRGYGMRFNERKEEIREKINQEVYYKDEARKLLEKGANDSMTTKFVESQDYAEGLRRSNKKDEFWNYELVVKGRLDGEGGEEGKYIVVYNRAKDILLRAIEYPYRVDFYATFVLNKRPNRLIGKSIPRKTRDMNDEIDTQHNQRINSRTISSVPTFKAHSDFKKEWDPQDPDNRWRPGMIMYSEHPEYIDQFKIQPTDLGESMAEEKNDFTILDLSLGAPAALFSGQANPLDPNAPGNKTAMMINQGNLRMDDTLQEDREGISMMGKICLSHLYQFGPPILEYVSDSLVDGQRSRQTKTIHKKFLRNGINLSMSGLTVLNNPDAEMAKMMQLHQFLLGEPLFAQNPKLRIEHLRDILKMGRIPGRNRYMPTVEELQRMTIEDQKRAILEIEAQNQQAQVDQQQADVENAMSDARSTIQMKNVADKLAEINAEKNGVTLQ